MSDDRPDADGRDSHLGSDVDGEDPHGDAANEDSHGDADDEDSHGDSGLDGDDSHGGSGLGGDSHGDSRLDGEGSRDDTDAGDVENRAGPDVDGGGSAAGSDPGEGRPRASDDAPEPVPGTSAARSDARSDDFLTRFRTAQTGPLVVVREVLTSVAAVLAFGLLLYAVSGIWPPMVAVESGSMEPNMQVGDLVFVTEPQRFSPDYAYGDTGVVPRDIAAERGYRTFGDYGSVVVYDPPARTQSPIIHRAHFWVEAGENWYDRANPDYVTADNCAELENCPAPHAGFITKGDANSRYDQANGLAEPVRGEWIEGAARLRVPYLGYIRLELAGHTGPVTFDRVDEPTAPVAAASRPSVAAELPSAAPDPTAPVASEPLCFESTGENVSRTDRTLAVR
jgi:signal peptidase